MKDHFECHITIANPDLIKGASRIELKEVAINQGWKTSEINGDPLLGDKLWFYFTKHSDSYESLTIAMNTLENYLYHKYGIVIMRKKIEQILLDIRM